MLSRIRKFAKSVLRLTTVAGLVSGYFVPAMDAFLNYVRVTWPETK